MPIQIFAFPNYYAKVLAAGKDKVFLLVPNLRFLLSNTCENKTDLDENGFSTINCRKSCQRPTEIFLFSKYHCTTLTVELELDVSACAQLKIFTLKNSFTWLKILQELCIFGPNNLSQIDVKR